MSKSNPKFQVKSRIWITSENGTYLGEGRIALLKEIERQGSIVKAAKEMALRAFAIVECLIQ